MSYQHYWSRITHIPEGSFELIVSDFRRCLSPLEAMGVTLAGGLGEGPPEIGPELVRFNGPVHCGHIQTETVKCPIPADDAAGVGSSLGAIVEKYCVDGDSYLGVVLRHRCCDGSCHYETFECARVSVHDPLPPGMADKWFKDEALYHDRDPNWYHDSCKTGFRPYDLAVQCFLVIAKHHLGDNFLVRSDGADFLWHDAYNLCHAVLDYPFREFHIIETEDEVRHLVPIAHLPVGS